MGNNSSRASSKSSTGTTDSKKLWEELKSTEKKICHLDYVKLKNLRWWYAWIGLHRIIELELYCSFCGKTNIIQMHKMTDGKHISHEGEHYMNGDGWYKKDYKPKNKAGINWYQCRRAFLRASGDYNGISNNCMNFAYEVKSRLIFSDSIIFH